MVGGLADMCKNLWAITCASTVPVYYCSGRIAGPEVDYSGQSRLRPAVEGGTGVMPKLIPVAG